MTELFIGKKFFTSCNRDEFKLAEQQELAAARVGEVINPNGPTVDLDLLREPVRIKLKQLVELHGE